MRSIIKFFVIISFSVMVTGCASGPKFAEVKDSFGTLNQQNGRIYLYRTTTLGAALQPKIKLNGEVIGKSEAKGFMFLDREPGTYKIMTSTEVDRELSFILEEGQTRYVKFGVTMGFFVGHVYPNLVEPEVGEKEILGCSYTGPNCD